MSDLLSDIPEPEHQKLQPIKKNGWIVALAMFYAMAIAMNQSASYNLTMFFRCSCSTQHVDISCCAQKRRSNLDFEERSGPQRVQFGPTTCAFLFP